MLKTIKSLSEYEQLYNEYVTEGHVRGYLNYFISKKNISAYINEEKIKYAVQVLAALNIEKRHP